MNITVLYDNTPSEGLVSGWGFAALINNTSLFDTSENEDSLRANMQVLGTAPDQIERVVISHEHSDHAGGIDIVRDCGDIAIYVPPGLSPALRQKIVRLNPAVKIREVTRDTQIDPVTCVTAAPDADIMEISLTVQTEKGLIIVTGCAHPGLDIIMKNARSVGNIYAIIGGFHGFDDLATLAEVPVIVPCHCTRRKQELKDMYPDQVRLVSVGTEIRLQDG